MKKLHTPNHKLYEQYYVNQAKQKGGSLPAFHGARFQRGYGLGSIFRGLFRWAMPHLQQGAKVIGKKALQTGVNVVQDVLDGDNIKTAVHKSTKQALSLHGFQFVIHFLESSIAVSSSNVTESGFRNSGNCCFWNPEYSSISQLSGIKDAFIVPLTKTVIHYRPGIWNPRRGQAFCSPLLSAVLLFKLPPLTTKDCKGP